ncbi:MAG TPA: NAD(P)-binding protein [Acidimicrobiales bacterium]|nr:NAD(P)-binding protein [Acidimicrobiales bacterium]
MTKLPFAITLEVGSSHANRTGSWRVERPVYVERIPPCNDGCPAGENIQQWLYHAESGAYEAAWRQLVKDNPFPAVMGRICYHPCETACNRARLDEAVGINAIERFLGDLAIERGWSLPSPGSDTNKRVLVVGGGPSGLSAAYHLRQLGHHVQLVDASERLGGMMRYGIPAYRLPRDILDSEIERIVDLGVEVRLNHTVHDVEREHSEGRFDAVYLGVGAQLARRVEIPSGDSAKILDAVSFLHRVADDEAPQLGQRVVVYGGGDTALDAARSARRLDASDAVIVYRRNRTQMSAHDEELEEALKEGITVRWLSTIRNFEGDRLTIEKMCLNEEGFPEPTGEFEELGADAVILALGQDNDLSLLDHVSDIEIDGGTVGVSSSMRATNSGIFAGGDAVPSERTATIAIGHGKRAARGIDAYLADHDLIDTPRHDLATFDHLNTWYYSDADRTRRPELALARRQNNFEEIVGGLSEDNALFEARRCLSCGNCFECDNCYGVCPDNAVIKLGDTQRYRFNYDFCKGCGICVSECPCGAIAMVPEQI